MCIMFMSINTPTFILMLNKIINVCCYKYMTQLPKVNITNNEVNFRLD